MTATYSFQYGDHDQGWLRPQHLSPEARKALKKADFEFTFGKGYKLDSRDELDAAIQIVSRTDPEPRPASYSKTVGAKSAKKRVNKRRKTTVTKSPAKKKKAKSPSAAAKKKRQLVIKQERADPADEVIIWMP